MDRAMIVTPTEAKQAATSFEARRRASLDSRIEAKKNALETTWRGRRRLRYIDREIKKAAAQGEDHAFIGKWDYEVAHAVDRYLHECGYLTTVGEIGVSSWGLVVRW